MLQTTGLAAMELAAICNCGVVAVVDGGSRLGLRCEIPAAKVCHPSVFWAQSIEIKPRTTLDQRENHGIHLFCLLTWCRVPRIKLSICRVILFLDKQNCKLAFCLCSTSPVIRGIQSGTESAHGYISPLHTAWGGIGLLWMCGHPCEPDLLGLT